MFFLLALAGPAGAAGGGLSEEALAGLRGPRVNDRDSAIGLLAADPSGEAAMVLEALAEGRLLLDRATGTLYVDGGPEGPAPLGDSGAAVPPDWAGLRKVGINNRQREALAAILGGRALLSPDPAARRRAAAALVSSRTVDLGLVGNLAARETDPGTRRLYGKILALGVLRDQAAGKGEVLGALRLLASDLTPEAREAMRAWMASGDPDLAAAAREAISRQDADLERIAFFETVFFGLSLGSVLALIGIGLAITFGVMGVINMAHGEMVMLGAYAVWGLQTMMPGRPGLALVLAIPVAFAATGMAGAALEMAVIRHLYSRPLETLLATYGVSLILQQAVKLIVSPNNRSVETPDFMAGLLRLSDHLAIAHGRLYVVGFCLAVFVLIGLVMRRSRLGLEVRAVTQNRAMAQALGVDARRVDTLTFALGSGVAGLAGVALSQLANVGPNLGQGYIVDSFMVVVFGGVGNLWGTFLGGLIIGLANKFLEPAGGAILAKILIMAGIILFIQRHPSGLFPQKGRAAAL
jgi:urea transport system permease protein